MKCYAENRVSFNGSVEITRRLYKTLKTFPLLICSLLIFLGSCSREDCTPPEKNLPYDPRLENTPGEYGMSYDGNVLIFNSISNYERAIQLDFIDENEDSESKGVKKRIFQQMLKNYNFQDYFSSRYNEEESTMDEWLGQFLNVDGVIQIADHLYKIDLAKEKVYVLEEKYKNSDYQALINGLVNGRVEEYSTEDDVFDEVTDKSPDAKAKRKNCGGVGGGTYVSASTSNGTIIKTFSDGQVWRLESFVKFFRAGIYYRLSSGHKVWAFPSKSSLYSEKIFVSDNTFSNDPEIMYIKQQIVGPQAWWKKRPCKNGSIGTHSATMLYYLNSKAVYQTSIYLGVRSLNGYYFFVRSNAHRYNGSETAFTNNAGRNINSPY